MSRARERSSFVVTGQASQTLILTECRRRTPRRKVSRTYTFTAPTNIPTARTKQLPEKRQTSSHPTRAHASRTADKAKYDRGHTDCALHQRQPPNREYGIWSCRTPQRRTETRDERAETEQLSHGSANGVRAEIRRSYRLAEIIKQVFWIVKGQFEDWLNWSGKPRLLHKTEYVVLGGDGIRGVRFAQLCNL